MKSDRPQERAQGGKDRQLWDAFLGQEPREGVSRRFVRG